MSNIIAVLKFATLLAIILFVSMAIAGAFDAGFKGVFFLFAIIIGIYFWQYTVVILRAIVVGILTAIKFVFVSIFKILY